MSTNHSDQDPWGKPGQNGSNSNGNQGHQNKENSPPDLEEIFNNLLKKMGGMKGNRSGSNHNGASPNWLKLWPIGLGLVVLFWAATGFYTIKEADRGVVLRLGKLHAIVDPGLNWKPNLLDEVIPVNVEQVKELRTQGSMLTRDENMVQVEMAVQYRVYDPAKYLFSVTNANDSLSQATDSALRYVIGNMTMDDILTTGRSTVRERTWKEINEIIKPYDMGLEVLDVNFQSARPPEEVKAAFDDAIKAQEDEQRYIREAEAYAREKEPKARGDAQRIVEKANAYKEQVVLNATGEVERFKRLLPEYKAAPELLRDRLYIQSMEKIMANTPKVMIDSKNGNNLTVLPLEKLLQGKKLETKDVTESSEDYVPTQYTKPEPESNSRKVQDSDKFETRKGRFN